MPWVKATGINVSSETDTINVGNSNTQKALTQGTVNIIGIFPCQYPYYFRLLFFQTAYKLLGKLPGCYIKGLISEDANEYRFICWQWLYQAKRPG